MESLEELKAGTYGFAVLLFDLTFCQVLLFRPHGGLSWAVSSILENSYTQIYQVIACDYTFFFIFL